MSQCSFKISTKFVNTILDNYFGIPNTNYLDTKVYVGLGIEFDEETFSFSKEPVSKGFTITSTPCEFNEPVNGILRNKNAIVWPKATEDWTKGSDAIKYIGLYYRRESDSFQQTEIYDYELIMVLPLAPSETVVEDEQMVLNPNAIQIKLSNR